MKLKLGMEVWSSEHPKGWGRVDYIHPNGDATIRFFTDASKAAPFGHKIDEFWPVADQAKLRSMQSVLQESVDSFFSVEGLR